MTYEHLGGPSKSVCRFFLTTLVPEVIVLFIVVITIVILTVIFIHIVTFIVIPVVIVIVIPTIILIFFSRLRIRPIGLFNSELFLTL